MALPKNRNACMSDLRAYFKKSDLLGGLTEPEKIELRKNIGVIDFDGEGSTPTPISITYSALNTLVKGKKLITGARYLITNYQTIYESNVKENGKYITWGKDINPSPTYSLLVTGISNDKLDVRAYIIEKPDWVIEYDITENTLDDGVKNKGTITYLKDSNGNSAHYDFKSVKFRRTRNELTNSAISINSPYIDLYTFSTINNNIAVDNSDSEDCMYNTIKENSWNNIFLGDTYHNIFEASFQNNTFLRGCVNNHFTWDTKNNFFNELVAYTSGSIAEKNFLLGDTTFSYAITKQIHKVYDKTILTFLDPITYSHQIVFI